MTDIVRRSDLTPSSSPVRIDRSTGRTLAALRAAGLVGEGEERLVAHLAAVRIDAAHQLGSTTVLKLKGLHSLISEISRDDAGLEMELRQIEQIVAIGSQQILVNFTTRPLL